jgi:hypothetical protein
MAALLAEMTERATEAERQRDAAKEDAQNWYSLYHDKDVLLKRAEAALSEQIKENEELRSAVREYIGNMQNGGTENE